MKKNILFIVLLLSILNIFAYTTIFEWRYLKDGRFTIYYPQGQYLYAKYAMNTLKEYAQVIDQTTGNKREQHVNIVLEDTGEYHNGLANPLENKLKLFLNTPPTSGSFTSQEWLNMLVIHEYTHHSHLTHAKLEPLLLSRIFGNVFSPNLYSPMWIVEGITVRNESYFSPYMGRLNNGYYTEIINAQLRDDKFQNHIKANYYLDDFPTGNYYIYGGAFVKWLADVYGEDKLTKFFDKYGSNLANIIFGSLVPKYTLDRTANKVFDKSFPELFEQWKNYLELSANFDKDMISQNIDHQWDNTILVSNLTSDDQNRLFFFETKRYFNHYRNQIISHDIGLQKSQIIYKSNSTLTTNMEIHDNTLYFSEEESDFLGNNLEFNGYSGTSVLKKLKLDDNNSTSIILQAPFKDFTVANTKVIYYTIEDINSMTSSLYKFTNNHHSLVKNYPFLLSELVYHDNKIFCTYKYQNSSWDIGVISLSDNSFSEVIKTKSQEKNLSIANNQIIFTSNQGNKSQAYSYDLTTKNIDIISNGFYADMPQVINNNLYYKSISGSGERISYAEISTSPSALNLVDDSRLITIMDDDYEEHNAVGESLAQLMIPYIRQPLGLLTSDGIGYFDISSMWYLDNSGKGVIEANLATKIFSPLYLNYYLTSNDTNNLSANLRLYNSQINWLNYLDLMGQTDFDNNNYLGHQVLFRKFDSTLINKNLFDLEDNGYANKTILSHNFKSVQISGIYEKVEKFDESPNFSENKIYSGKSSYIDYGLVTDFNLVKVRNGFWTPNIAMRDIDLSLGIYQNNYRSDDNVTYFKVSAISDIFVAGLLQFKIESGIYFNENKVRPLIRLGTEF